MKNYRDQAPTVHPKDFQMTAYFARVLCTEQSSLV
jgi:hypothetical protein